MRVTVIGGHGRTGLLLVKQLIAARHLVVATIRNPQHGADLVALGAEPVTLDLTGSNVAEFASAMSGSDVVIFAAGSTEGETSELDRNGTQLTIAAAEQAGVQRYVAISAIGASTGMATASMSDEMQDYYEQKRAAAGLIHASTLHWTIVEPAELTEDAGIGQVAASLDPLEPKPIARADVAAFVVAVLDEPKSIGKAIQLAGGSTAITAALQQALT